MSGSRELGKSEGERFRFHAASLLAFGWLCKSALGKSRTKRWFARIKHIVYCAAHGLAAKILYRFEARMQYYRQPGERAT